MNRRQRKVITFYDFAESLKQLSACKRLGVAAIVTPPDFSAVLAIGYNGPASGEPDDACTAEVGKCRCVHAEVNALLKLGRGHEKDLWLMTTTGPCVTCAGAIINSKRIGMVVVGGAYRDEGEGVSRVQAAGVAIASFEYVVRSNQT